MLDIENVINAFIIDSSICQKYNNQSMKDQSYFMINRKFDGNNHKITTIDEKLKETFSEHSEKSLCKTMTQKIKITTLVFLSSSYISKK